MMRNGSYIGRSRSSFAPGKIILSGEYAVIYGFSGIAIPSTHGIEVIFEESPTYEHVEVHWKRQGIGKTWQSYAEKIVTLCQKHQPRQGRLVINADLPLGKGMGSSTALLIATTRALLGQDAREVALSIEDSLNPAHSGFDFTTIWEGVPILYRKGEVSKPVSISSESLQEALLIDTGTPSESTADLVAWMQGRETEVQKVLQVIGRCTERLLKGEPLDVVMHEHHRAQVALGVVPQGVQELVGDIEQNGGAAKVIGAGSRFGGAGMVLALGNQEKNQNIANERGMSTMAP